MDVKLLGPFEVWEGGRRLTIGGGKQQALLLVLVLHRNEVVTSDRIIEALWGGRPPPTAAKNVQIYVSQLRKALGEHAIATRSRGYAVELTPEHVDAARFEELLGQGRELLETGDVAGAAAVLTDGLALWRGPALADFEYAEFAQPEIRRLEELRIAALEERVEADLALGRHTRLVPELETLTREHPLRERLRAQLMRALYQSGRQAEALEAFRETRETLVEQLGLEPGRSLQELERQILEQDPELDAPRRRAADRLPGRRLLVLGGLVVAGAASAIAVAFSGGSKTVHVGLNAVGVIDPKTNRVVAQVPVGINPVAIALTAGRVWVVNEEDRTVSQIDARTRRLVGTIALDGAPTGITTANGFVWVLNATTPENTTPDVEITKINPRFGGIIDRIPTDLSYGEVLEGSLAVTGESAWVPSAHAYSPAEILERIDVARHRVIGRFRLFGPRRASEGIVSAGGAVWFHDARGLVRLDPRTGNMDVVEVRGGGGVAIGLGRAWIGARFFPSCLLAECPNPKSGYVASVDARGHAVRTTIDAGDPAAIAVGEGSVWVANRNTHNVQRIDPKTTRTVATIRLDNSPTALAIGDGAVWVVVS